MTKYYYKDQLVRTSKSRDDYKYALLYVCKDGTFKACKCSSKKEYCEQELDYKTKAETIANQTGKTIEEVWKDPKYKLWSSQLCKRENYIIVELEVRA